ncbi:MAG: hypothetical protein Q4D79_05570 [Propionibacteriaceae bacterium]|nr:hypothetical protein [Propionibacteriaceae bacterium]
MTSQQPTTRPVAWVRSTSGRQKLPEQIPGDAVPVGGVQFVFEDAGRLDVAGVRDDGAQGFLDGDG